MELSFHYPNSNITGKQSNNRGLQRHVIVEDPLPTDHSLMIIDDKSGATIISSGPSNLINTSVLESLSEEDDDDSSSTTEGGADRAAGGRLDGRQRRRQPLGAVRAHVPHHATRRGNTHRVTNGGQGC